jgi:thiol-disulfide isomerase/thioredoxin
MKSFNYRIDRFKIILNFILIGLGVSFLVLLFFFRGSMNSFVTKKMKEQTSVNVKKSISQLVDSAFNYQKNGKGFGITFLEFGATGCISCRKMEIVMKEVKEKYPQRVNVKFYNILLPENQDMMKYFGIAAIPTQVLMDSSGNEVYRHTGYFSTAELEKEFIKINALKIVQ